MNIIQLADSATSRAAVVGWVLLAVVGAVIFMVIVMCLSDGFNSLWMAMDNFREYHPRLHLGWLLFGVGILLVALGFIFASVGTAVVGGLVLIFLWRMNENSNLI